MKNFCTAEKTKAAREAVRLLGEGRDWREVCRLLKMKRSTLERWVMKWRAGGAAALESRRHQSGRRPVAEDVPEEFARKLRGLAAKCHSAVLAWRRAKDWPDCPPGIRSHLEGLFARGGRIDLPMSLRRLCQVPPEAEAKRKSDTAFGHVALKGRHEAKVRDPRTGRVRELLAGDIYLSDDMSVNHPFWFELPPGETKTRAGRGDKLAERFGVAVGRQGLYTIDARGKWLGVDLIGRPSDAYTAADVLRHFRHVVKGFGLPRLGWVLEKGVWCARTVDGVRVAVDDDGAKKRIVAGLESLGIEVKHVWTSEGKALVEGAFGNLQNWLDLQNNPTVGRQRGEMERIEAVMRRVRAGTVHPQDVGLPDIAQELGEVQAAMLRCNETPKAGRIQEGIPDERWARDTEAHPLAVPESEQWGVFMPWKAETQIRQGHVEATVDGRNYRFTAPEVFAELGSGYRVLMGFDPDDPAAGACCWNLETGARNILRAPPGGWLCNAEYSSPMLLWGDDDDARAAHEARKKRFTRAFTAAWAGTGLWGVGAKKGVEKPGAHSPGGAGDPPAAAAVEPPAPRRRAFSARELDDIEAALAAKEAELAEAGAFWG